MAVRLLNFTSSIATVPMRAARRIGTDWKTISSLLAARGALSARRTLLAVDRGIGYCGGATQLHMAEQAAGGGRQAFPSHPLSPRDRRDDTRNRRIISDLNGRGIEHQPQLGELGTPPQHPLPMRGRSTPVQSVPHTVIAAISQDVLASQDVPPLQSSRDLWLSGTRLAPSQCRAGPCVRISRLRPSR